MTPERVRLLIADDHLMFRRSLRALLELDPSFEVVGEAGNGLHLLALVDLVPADVILMDMAMPGLTGIEVLERLDEECRRRVIVLTANSSLSEMGEARRLGVACVLLKDVEIEALQGAVRRVAAAIAGPPGPVDDTGSACSVHREVRPT